MLLKLHPPFLFGTKLTSLEPKQLSMTTVVRAVFRLRPGAPVAPIESPIDQGFLSGDRFHDDDEERVGELLFADDFADLKLATDVLLRGTAHAGEGHKATDLTVSFHVGAWSKSLRVFGRRVWTENPFHPISKPIPFTSVPLTYANAFGGPDDPRNPVGRGHETPELPSIEDPRAPLRSKSDTVEPACFGPLNPSWPQRAGKQGEEYGPSWLETRAPFFARDFDWSFFNAAPRDQQLLGYLRGDEELVFENLHPTAKRFTARLPGLRPVVLVRYQDGETRALEMKLDTLLAEVDDERLVLTWRGLAPVKEDDFADVRTLFIAPESMTDPRPHEHYVALLDEFERDPLERDQAIPKDVRDEIEAAKAMAEKARAEATAKAKEPPPSRDAIAWLASVIAKQGDKLPPEQREATAQMLERMKEMRDKGQAKLAEMRAHGQEPPPPPKRDAIEDALLAMIDTQKAAAEKRGLPVDRLDAAKAKLAEARDRRRATEAKLREAAKTSPGVGATLGALDAADGGAPPPEPEPGRGVNLMGRDLSKRNLSGKDLEGALLRKANLSGARLAGANLRRADLGDADLTGADLAGADLTSANLTGAKAKGAVFDGAKLDMTIFSSADLTGASLDEATGKMTLFGETILVNARVRRARFWKAVFNAAKLARADFTGADLAICLFLSADAPSARFDETTLDRAGFFKSVLSRATFVAARGAGGSWQEAQLDGADFRYAVLPGAQLTGARLDGATFFAARLHEARFKRASLVGTDFSRSDCLSAVFDKATLTETRFVGANLFDSKFLGTVTPEKCDFEDANRKRAQWRLPA